MPRITPLQGDEAKQNELNPSAGTRRAAASHALYRDPVHYAHVDDASSHLDPPLDILDSATHDVKIVGFEFTVFAASLGESLPRWANRGRI